MGNNQDLHRDENGEDMTAEQENSVRDEGSVADDTVTDETVTDENTGEVSYAEETDAEETDCAETDAEENDETESSGEAETPDTKSKFASIVSVIYDYAEIFAVSIIAVIFLFSFGIRLCRVDGSSMNQTLKNDEPLIAANFFYTPKQGDIVVFHLVNDYYHEPLVKRVIALEGQTVEIDMTNNQITVDGEVYADEHAYLSGGAYEMRYEFDKQYIFKDGERTVFRATVPEGKIFVLGDNRNGSSDSRSVRVGFVDKRSVLGRAVLRLSPFAILD